MATDYNALAAQNGAISSNPPPVSSAPAPRANGGSVDYNALAAQNGSINSTPAPATEPPLGDDLSEYGQQAAGPQTDSVSGTFGQDHPTATNIGRGLGDTVSDVRHSITGIPSGIWHSLPPVQLADTMKRSLPVIDAYEKARANGASITDSIKSADQQARQQDTIGTTIKKVSDAFKANPTRETARALGDATALAVSIFAGGGAAAEGAAEGATGAEAGLSAAPEVAGDLEGSTAAATHAYNPETASIEPVTQPGTLKTLVTNPKALVSEGAAKASTQPSTQAVVRSGASDIAEAAGVEDSASLSTAKTVEDVADNVYAQSKGLYKQVDDATGGKFAGNEQLIKNVDKELRMASSDEEVTSLQAQRSKYVAQQNQLFDDAAAQGVPREVVDQAKASYKQSNALRGLDHQIKMSTKGVPTDIAEKGSIPETIDPKILSDRVNKLYRSGDLTDAFGGNEARAAQFVNKMSQAAKTQGAAISRAKIGKWIAGSVASAAGVGGAEIAHKLLTN